MKRESDRAYLERRAREEREKAENASDPIGYRTHLEFARAYERRIVTDGQDNIAAQAQLPGASGTFGG